MDNVKAIFLDMDGTILHKNNRVDSETADVIAQLRSKGVKVFLATGRAHNEIHYLVPETFEVDGIISSNGTLGMVNDEIIFKHSLSFNAVNEIVSRAQQQSIYYEVFPFEGNRIVLAEDEAWAKSLFDAETPPGKVGESEWTSRKESIVEKVDWSSELPSTTYSKIYLFSTDFDKITAYREQLKKDAESLQISVSNSSRFNAETMAYQTDKGTGIKEMIEHFGIEQSETLVIGDSDNDRAMFEFGHYTVAMKNARPEIQSLTKDVTSYTNEENGAARYLAEHFLK
ncbi:Cof-type HAD-IIB family hydrolase [Staphylococcus gallinarum]|uniref:HAD family hydrolase n=1 Tax=Staphylococcus gallinarum TaxID=1293 RepID=UPI000D1DB918|nr:HAD family hydrolase [Staphylococcus gallinarum]MCD8822275.1 Cof-type HAD-IIB family hydrolase [Staphylococcus gallinarum]MCQ9289688.1 Cof-type HAD-IIB family hydrolase [Staphylococcus gallinarum]PTL07262.1 Cof-type HAD-IIB family hydrolase [Staphylococcus gallinarum]PTL08222.1 Cof-type HAD-IIB family hydrolase [Staphylococcus gallinarum]RIL34764.1 HAD family phosphatase [Staphylococcus gallinarum]